MAQRQFHLMQILTHLLVTGEEGLSLSSFLMVQDIAVQLGSDHLDKCLSRTYKAFVAHCKFVQPTNLKHLEFLTDSIVELYSLDIQQSYQKIHLSLQHLANTLWHALKTKKKVELTISSMFVLYVYLHSVFLPLQL